ncbi:aminotransferase class I/II-fold pyridoxal phosphate-dependent enzyme [Suttonella sp. R2A3]|uniref:aminotransferase class I/II-fold pyridoxal phosphate-dependent enzyme n=1 Tax=Suttonella sp. R2A3 TaxID=2908648 RepID=UPI001F4324B7|nr:aminotransferase class I/II-fold pyridoxal phosphate-dependent enzyme [Suttonella sp. R2A3]UJF24910.1 aminotransferase class I/II-fold pyridoxal phosphate-dependent enzyme [Suttonella sp. R2A3]
MREILRDQLNILQQTAALRTLPLTAHPGVDLLSNDYLGIAANTVLYEQFVLDWFGAGGGASSASASRLLGGNAVSSASLEETASAIFKRDVLYLNSGYHANIGILPALTARGDLILADKAIHASLIDGARLTQAKLLRYPHQDLTALEALLRQHRAAYRRVWIATESVFSMDGSCSDLRAICALKQQYDAQLYVDEAHAVGIFAEGRGLAQAQGVLDQIDICVMPCAKALASYGALVLCDAVLRTYLINHCRSLIFASALPPIVTAWTEYVLKHLVDFTPQRQKIQRHSQMLRQALGLKTDGLLSPIVAWVIGENAPTMNLAAALAAEGIHVGAIRHPTVPQGAAQLRLCVHAGLSSSEIDEVIKTIQRHTKAVS